MNYLPIGNRHSRLVKKIEKLRQDLPWSAEIEYDGRSFYLVLSRKYVKVEAPKYRVRFTYDSMVEFIEDMATKASRPAWVAFGADDPSEVDDPYEQLIDDDSDAWQLVEAVKKELKSVVGALEDWQPEDPMDYGQQMRDQLTRMGSVNKDLRPHIRAILSATRKKARRSDFYADFTQKAADKMARKAGFGEAEIKLYSIHPKNGLQFQINFKDPSDETASADEMERMLKRFFPAFKSFMDTNNDGDPQAVMWANHK